jgi:hypothetical protein
MKLILIRRMIGIALLVGLFSQFAMADNASSVREIVGIVSTMNHFASDADKAKLMAIAADNSLAAPIRAMASAVSNIAHAANAEDKAAMASIVGNAQVPDPAKTLAGIIANFNHMASDDDKARLSASFGL